RLRLLPRLLLGRERRRGALALVVRFARLGPGLEHAGGRAGEAEQEHSRDRGGGDDAPAVSPVELREAIACAGRAGEDGLLAEVTLHVVGEGGGRLVPTCAVLLQRLHDDPVQVTAELPAEMAWIGAPVARNVLGGAPCAGSSAQV